jgi:hypothetical protein
MSEAQLSGPTSNHRGSSKQLGRNVNIAGATKRRFSLGPLAVWKDAASTVQAIATTLALGAAGWWFLRQGIAQPHLNLTHAVHATKIHDK